MEYQYTHVQQYNGRSHLQFYNSVGSYATYKCEWIWWISLLGWNRLGLWNQQYCHGSKCGSVQSRCQCGGRWQQCGCCESGSQCGGDGQFGGTKQSRCWGIGCGCICGSVWTGCRSRGVRFQCGKFQSRY